jgi:hypothetical protein
MIKKFCKRFVCFLIIVSFAQEGTSSPYFYGIGMGGSKEFENCSMAGVAVEQDSIH